MASDGHISHVLSVLFNADFFKEAQFKKVKNPTELVTGILKLIGSCQGPQPGMAQYASATQLMGQKLLDPPTVEGWHTGKEWIDGGSAYRPRQLRCSRSQRCIETGHSGYYYTIEEVTEIRSHQKHLWRVASNLRVHWWWEIRRVSI